MKRKKNNKVWDALTQKRSEYLIQAGWFEGTKYDNGAPVGGIAAVQNYGGTIEHPGGTPFIFSDLAQRAIFISKSSNLGHILQSKGMITKPHTIVIPPTHFWEKCQEENKEKWKKLIRDAWSSVSLGNIEPDKAMEMIAMQIQRDIANAIEDVNEPPLKASTIKQKLSKYKDQKTVGDLGKRLGATGLMKNSVSYKVTKK